MPAPLEDNDSTRGPHFILDGKASSRLLAEGQEDVLEENGITFQDDTGDDAPVGRPTYHQPYPTCCTPFRRATMQAECL